MKYTPADILHYVYEENLESAFLSAILMQKEGYSIAEVADSKFTVRDDSCRLHSRLYKLHIPVTDDEIVTAVRNQLHVSTFLSRRDDSYQVHFLVHRYPESMRERFEEAIAKEVVQYMIAKTILALRLDSPKRVKAYLDT